MAACTLRRSGSLTGTEPVITWETVPTETPAISATFLMLGMQADYSFFRRILRASIFMGGPLWHCMPIRPSSLASGGIVIDEHAGDAAVEELDDGVAAGDEVQIVPVVAFDQFLQFFAIADRADDRRLSCPRRYRRTGRAWRGSRARALRRSGRCTAACRPYRPGSPSWRT